MREWCLLFDAATRFFVTLFVYDVFIVLLCFCSAMSRGVSSRIRDCELNILACASAFLAPSNKPMSY
jgi:hypothetical protein